MNRWVIAVDDPRAADVYALLQQHLEYAVSTTQPENVHALDIERLLSPDITMFSVREGGALLGVGALKQLDEDHFEIKSMHTATSARRRGVGRALVDHLVDTAISRGARQVSLETGSQEAFAPARKLYATCGFVPCGAFGDYPAKATSTFMTLPLEGADSTGPRSSDLPPDDGTSSPLERSTGNKVARAVVTLGIMAAVFGGLFPRLTDYSEVLPIITDLTTGEVIVLVILAVWFLAAYWPVLMAVLPTLRLREAAVNQLSGTAFSNTVPAGGAIAVGVNYAIYLSWGFTSERVWAALLTAGVWDGFIKAGLPVAAFGLLALTSGDSVAGWTVPLTSAAVLALISGTLITVLRSASGAAAVGRVLARIINPPLRLLGREPIDFSARLEVFRSTLGELVSKAWKRLTIAMLANHLAMFSVFVASMRFVGVTDISLFALLAAFSLARLLSGVPLTPGGLGIVDAGYVGLLLLSAGGDSEAAIVAGVLLFRALTFFPPIPLGLGTWLFWRSNRSWRRPLGSRPDTPSQALR